MVCTYRVASSEVKSKNFLPPSSRWNNISCVKGILPTIFRYIESDKLIFSKAVLPKKYFWLKDLQEYLSVVHSKIDIDDFWLITTTIAHIPKTVRNCFTYGYLIPIFKGRPLRARLWMCVICKFDMQFYIEWF